jgi:Mrp family chromosome partitioning ATPase
MADTGRTSPAQDDSSQQKEPGTTSRKSLVRLLKPIVVSPERGKNVDANTVSPRYYNCFNYSLIAKDHVGVNLTVGITSPNQGDGKTLVAANLAVSLAMANERETVLVDLNIRSPQLHNVFGTRLNPGLVESLSDQSVQINQTPVKHLYLLSAGSALGNPMVAERIGERGGTTGRQSVGLEHVAAFRDVLYSLKQEFEFVIVDMPALQEPRIPILLTHQMDGLLVVVDSRRTKHEDIEKLFRRVNQNQVLGFVFNRTVDDSYE